MDLIKNKFSATFVPITYDKQTHLNYVGHAQAHPNNQIISVHFQKALMS